MRAGLWRAAVEGLLGWALLGAASGRLWWRWELSASALPRLVLLVAAWAWLIAWPAWRLQRVAGGGRWRRAGRSLVRLLGLASIFTIVVEGVTNPSLEHASLGGLIESAALIAALLLLARSGVVAAGATGSWVRRRIARQLMMSHLAVIMITFVGLLAVSVAIATVVVVQVLPDARNQASSVAETLQPPSTARFDAGRAQGILDAVVWGRVHISSGSSSPLMRLLPWTGINRRTLLLDPGGTVLAQTGNREVNTDARRWCRRLPAGARLPEALWRRLGPSALAGRRVTAPVPTSLACGGPGERTGDQLMAAAPMRARGRVVAVVVVQGVQPATLLSPTVASVAVGVFTAAALAVIVLTVLPTLAISSLAGYLLARGLTRRLVALSRAAEAIAAGDLSRRAPVNAQNEIGRLAQDFNQMAAYLERAIAELRRARAQAEEALRARQELVASVSHELRTPIAIVQAQLDMLRMHSAEEHASIPMGRATLEALHAEMSRLAALVNDLFSLARVETGALDVRIAPVDLAALVRSEAALLRPLAQRESAVVINVEAQPDMPPALADADRLRQILANLVRNAIRHTPEGGIIALGIAHQDRWLVLTVADTGEGIEPEHLPHIFDRFYRVDQARTRAAGGAGLGLAIVREFVEKMGGRVTVRSVVGEGTCFEVSLPAATVAPEMRPRDVAAPR